MLHIGLSIWICLMPMFFPVSASAQIYKWTDQYGKVQYGDQPPASSKDLGLVNANPSREHGQTSETWKEKERDFRKRRIENQMRAEKEASIELSGQQICRRARYKLQALDGKAVYRVNDKGERVFMEDAERNAIETKAKEDIDKYCAK